jgi:hypothetical protein
MTKYTDAKTLVKMLGLMGMRYLEGRHEIAPAAAGC